MIIVVNHVVGEGQCRYPNMSSRVSFAGITVKQCVVLQITSAANGLPVQCSLEPYGNLHGYVYLSVQCTSALLLILMRAYEKLTI